MAVDSSNIVIVGGGFAGTTLARRLERHLPENRQLVLVSRDNCITYNPLLADVIFCLSTPAVRAFKRVTRSVPIVFVNANNPVSCDQLPGSKIFHAFSVKSKALWSWPSARQSRRP